jgi:tetratricopeptide (TPR) repeat protein
VKNKLDSVGVANILKAISMDTTTKELYGDLAEAYFSQKKYLIAAETYEKKIDGNKITLNDYFFLGRAYYFGMDFVKSDTAFSNLLKIKPDFANAWLYRARNNNRILNADGSSNGISKISYEKFIELTINDPKYNLTKSVKDLTEAYRFLGIYYIGLKEDAISKPYWLKIIEIDPSNKEANTILKDWDKK